MERDISPPLYNMSMVIMWKMKDDTGDVHRINTWMTMACTAVTVWWLWVECMNHSDMLNYDNDTCSSPAEVYVILMYGVFLCLWNYGKSIVRSTWCHHTPNQNSRIHERIFGLNNVLVHVAYNFFKLTCQFLLDSLKLSTSFFPEGSSTLPSRFTLVAFIGVRCTMASSLGPWPLSQSVGSLATSTC